MAIKQIPKTTDSVEAWHKKINQKITMAHPNIITFIQIIQKGINVEGEYTKV
jgi:maltose-binding protein MalE